MASKEYLISTCLGCKKCLYCGIELSIKKKMCVCNKTIKPSIKNRTEQVKIAFSRISKPNLPLKQLEYIQESITRFDYSLDLSKTFKFSFCPACNSAFQRRKSNNILELSTLNSEFNSNRNNSENSESSYNNIDLDEPESEMNEKSDIEQVIAFNLIIKPYTGLALPSKWVEIGVSSLDDILADIHFYAAS